MSAARSGEQPEDSTVHLNMPRKKRKRSNSVVTVNLTPTIDITFNLLIFFLVATTFKTAEGILPTKVPVEQGVVAATPLPISPIKVRIRQIGDGPADYQVSIDNWRRTPQTFLDLTLELEFLLDKPGFDSNTPVVIVPDMDVQWDHVVNCFNAIRRSNLRKGVEHTFKNITFVASR